jgi:hypothetical protein
MAPNQIHPIASTTLTLIFPLTGINTTKVARSQAYKDFIGTNAPSL